MKDVAEGLRLQRDLRGERRQQHIPALSARSSRSFSSRAPATSRCPVEGMSGVVGLAGDGAVVSFFSRRPSPLCHSDKRAELPPCKDKQQARVGEEIGTMTDSSLFCCLGRRGMAL